MASCGACTLSVEQVRMRERERERERERKRAETTLYLD
jgi:hypothetical protein